MTQAGDAGQMLSDILDFLLPAPCLVCGELPKPLCTECEPVFGTHQEGGDFFAADLDENLNLILGGLKDRNRTAVIGQLAKGFRPCLERAIEQTNPTVLVCPPSSKKNFRKRGYNPALMLLRAANPSGLTSTDRVLRHLRQPIDQRSLGAEQRQENLDGIFESRISSGRVLLVDDVKTTGATLRTATEAIQSQGAEVVGTCVLAKRNSISLHHGEK